MSSMMHPTFSSKYKTERLSWPKSIPRTCPLCGKHIRFKYSDNGKLVHTRKGTINQVMNLYVCVDPNCPMHSTPFNPAPRFDYGDGYYGADVFRYVADEVLCIKSKPEQFFKHLEAEGVPISPSTVQRMCDDALNLAAFRIDEKTREMLAADPRETKWAVLTYSSDKITEINLKGHGFF